MPGLQPASVSSREIPICFGPDSIAEDILVGGQIGASLDHIEMRSQGLRLVAMSAVLFVASCSLYEDYEASTPAKIMETEARLVKAGFERVPIQTPEQGGAVEQLPLHRLNRYSSVDGSVFWYADPTVCSCLYEGDQAAYDRYAGQLQQEHDTAEYMNQQEPAQLVNLSPFGYAFPPPLIFRTWPVWVPPIRSGGFHSSGGTGAGSGVKSSGGGGGAIHSHGGGGGGHHGVHGGGIRSHH